MNPSLEFLERSSAETGFQAAMLEKVVLLGAVAADVARHPLLGAVLALKGGTALNRCFGPPGRLSVDLDYNYIGHVERERMLEDRPRVEEAVLDLARRRGHRVQQSADAFAGRKLYLRYRSVLGQDERVEDAWDVACLSGPAAETLVQPLFRARFIALSATLEHPLPTYGRDRLAGLLTDRTVATELAPTLARGVPPRSDDLVERAWAKVGPLLSLRGHEEAYLAAID